VRQIGPPLKLVNAKGEYLGVLHIPHDVSVPTEDQWDQHIYLQRAFPLWHDPGDSFDVTDSFVVITLSHRVRGAVELYHKTPEEISREEGFAFTPSVEYIRATWPP
jgi:hypothetical protein